MKTYKEIAIERIMSIGINSYCANEIVELMINEGDFGTQVFNDFQEDLNDDWNAPIKYVKISNPNILSITDMEKIILSEVSFDKISKNSYIYKFHKVGKLCISVELETDNCGNEVYTYNLFVDDAPIFINGKASKDEKYNLIILHDLTKNWNFWIGIIEEKREN